MAFPTRPPLARVDPRSGPGAAPREQQAEELVGFDLRVDAPLPELLATARRLDAAVAYNALDQNDMERVAMLLVSPPPSPRTWRPPASAPERAAGGARLTARAGAGDPRPGGSAGRGGVVPAPRGAAPARDVPHVRVQPRRALRRGPSRQPHGAPGDRAPPPPDRPRPAAPARPRSAPHPAAPLTCFIC